MPKPHICFWIWIMTYTIFLHFNIILKGYILKNRVKSNGFRAWTNLCSPSISADGPPRPRCPKRTAHVCCHHLHPYSFLHPPTSVLHPDTEHLCAVLCLHVGLTLSSALLHSLSLGFSRPSAHMFDGQVPGASGCSLPGDLSHSQHPKESQHPCGSKKAHMISMNPSI